MQTSNKQGVWIFQDGLLTSLNESRAQWDSLLPAAYVNIRLVNSESRLPQKEARRLLGVWNNWEEFRRTNHMVEKYNIIQEE